MSYALFRVILTVFDLFRLYSPFPKMLRLHNGATGRGEETSSRVLSVGRDRSRAAQIKAEKKRQREMEEEEEEDEEPGLITPKRKVCWLFLGQCGVL